MFDFMFDFRNPYKKPFDFFLLAANLAFYMKFGWFLNLFAFMLCTFSFVMDFLVSAKEEKKEEEDN